LKKQLLKLSYSVDFELVGIISHLQEYKVAHHLNSHLQLGFKRVEDWQLNNENKGKKLNTGSFFRQYFYKNDILRCTFHLLQNKALNEVCLPEFSIIDYLLIIFGETDDIFTKDLLKKIKLISGINSALMLDVNKIKNIENILIDEAIF